MNIMLALCAFPTPKTTNYLKMFWWIILHSLNQSLTDKSLCFHHTRESHAIEWFAALMIRNKLENYHQGVKALQSHQNAFYIRRVLVLYNRGTRTHQLGLVHTQRILSVELYQYQTPYQMWRLYHCQEQPAALQASPMCTLDNCLSSL